MRTAAPSDRETGDFTSTPEDASAIEAMLVAGKLPIIEKSQRVIYAYKARTARLEHEQKCSELVNKAGVVAEHTARVVTTRTKLLGVPAKFKARAPEATVARSAARPTICSSAAAR